MIPRQLRTGCHAARTIQQGIGCVSKIHDRSQMCDDDHISFTESVLVIRGEDGGCYARSTLHSRCGRTAHRRLDRRRCRWSEDIRSQKPLLFRRPRQWSRDSRACEHEKLSDGAVAAVICYLHFQLTAPTLPSVVAGAAVFTIAAAPC
jgi:hypothetical protein